MEITMAINKTLYVRDEDAAVWDEAKKIVGDSLSAYLTNHLRTLVDLDKAEARGFERILLTFREGGLPRTKSFYGRWLIPPDDAFKSERVVNLPLIEQGEVVNVFKRIASVHIPFTPYSEEEKATMEAITPGAVNYAVAITAKERIAIFQFDGQRSDGTFVAGNLRSFDSFEIANTFSDVPSELIARAMKIRGVPIEELDI
jgi:hypothetical protein